MANKLNISDGTWKFEHFTKSYPKSIIVKTIIDDKINDSFELEICHVLPKIHTGRREANAELICDAGNTYQTCELLPSELLQQRNEAVNILKRVMHSNEDINELYNEINELIQKITQ